jgi:hypothetical protein
MALALLLPFPLPGPFVPQFCHLTAELVSGYFTGFFADLLLFGEKLMKH